MKQLPHSARVHGHYKIRSVLLGVGILRSMCRTNVTSTLRTQSSDQRRMVHDVLQVNLCERTYPVVQVGVLHLLIVKYIQPGSLVQPSEPSDESELKILNLGISIRERHGGPGSLPPHTVLVFYLIMQAAALRCLVHIPNAGFSRPRCMQSIQRPVLFEPGCLFVDLFSTVGCNSAKIPRKRYIQTSHPYVHY